MFLISKFNNLKVGAKIGLGFALLTFVIIASIMITFWQTGKVKNINSRIIELRVPTAQASLEMLNGINHSLAALRGWMLLGKDNFKQQREKAWTEGIEPSFATMKKFSANWTAPKNIERLNIIETKLADFKKFQKEIEDIANTIGNLPANQILLEQAAPKAAILVGNITKIIDIEAKQPATPQRKALLGMMADVRGTTARSLANIRGYLLSGDNKFKQQYETMWTKNIKRFGDLTRNASLLTPEQKKLFDEFSKARSEFAVFPPKMFQIRSGDQWNLANNWLGTKAAPTAFAIKKQLNEMVTSQKTLLNTDMAQARDLGESLSSTLVIIMIFGLLISGTLGYFITRSISKPIEILTDVSRNLAAGNLKQKQIKIDSEDELGILSKNFNQMLDGFNQLMQKADDIAAGRLNVNAVKEKLNKGLSLNDSVHSDNSNQIQGDLAESFEKMEKELRKVAVQTTIVADDDLQNPVLNEKISGELGAATEILVENLRSLKVKAEAQAEVEREQIEKDRQQAEKERQQAEELRSKVDSMLEVVNAASEGDLTKEMTVSGSDAIGQMGEGLKNFFGKLSHDISSIGKHVEILATTSEQLSSASQQMAGNAEETSAQANVVSAASEQVTTNINTVATGSEEMSASIKEIAKSSSEAANVASQAVKTAKTTNDTIIKLAESSSEIGEVVKVITSIAEQTNLLALNATIEAARAGEAGKGFAVVANEVKDLATQTAQATEDISKRIESIQADTEGAVSAMDEIGKVINQINDISSTIASAVEEQTATTNEITRNVNEAAKGTQEISVNISGVAQAALSTTHGSQETQTASGDLSKMASELKNLISQFKC